MAAVVNKKSVYIVGSELGHEEMFRDQGWNVTTNIKNADLIQFTGGSDVDPSLYHQLPLSTTSFSTDRDKKELLIVHLAKSQRKPMAGICRGGQFLNILMGGNMWQHVDSHDFGSHLAHCSVSKKTMRVSSTHHQMMIPGNKGKVIMTSSCSYKKKRMERGEKISIIEMVYSNKNPNKEDDVEAIIYENHKILCFQPHPEYVGYENLAQHYFYYLNKFLFNTEKGL